MALTLTEQLEEMHLGDHLCLVYESWQEQMAAFVPYLKQGLERNEACIYMVDDRTVGEVRAALIQGGIDVESEEKRGALTFATKRQSYIHTGNFDPDLMIQFLDKAVQDALRKGFDGYRITGEMTWALGDECGCDRLIEYEAKLNRYFPSSRSTAICQYNRTRFPPELIHDVLRTHPMAIIGDQVCPNPYFEDPKLVLSEGSSAERVDWMTSQLRKFRASELKLRETIAAHDERTVELEKSEERFRTLADNIPQLAWMTDETGWIFWYNRRWFEYTGTSLKEMEGWGWKSVHHPDHVDRVEKKFRISLETGSAWEDTFPLRGKDGKYRWFLSRALPIRDPAGKVIRWFGTNTDITEELEVKRQLDEAVRARDEFISVASHELKTPITSMQMQVQLLDRSFKRDQAAAVEPARLGKSIEVSKRQLERLNRLVEDMLDISRISTGKLTMEKRRLDLSELIADVVDRFQEICKTSGCELRSDLEPGIAGFFDQFRLEQVVLNLLNNAIKYGNGKPVDISLRKAGPSLAELRVRDYGMGIPKEAQSRIFERFERAVSGTGISGLGLGLHIVRTILEAHSARIQVESEPGSGAEFKVQLPLGAADERAANAAA
jgi:PAS domain S-box-containing protein